MLVAEESIEPIMRTVCTKCKSLRVNGPICSVHKNLLPELSSIQDCTICSGFDKLPSLKNRSIVLNSMTESLNELKTIDEFVEWIPEIGTQLVSCTERANDLDDIASFPGRIIKVKDEIMTVSKPEFGSSKTMSSLLLWIGKSQPNIRWILSLKNKAKLLELLKKKNIPFLETSELDIKWDKTLAKLSKNPKISNIKILLDNASSGYESIAYLFAESEKKLSALLRDVIT